MPRDDATDEGKVQVVGKNRELRLLTTRSDSRLCSSHDSACLPDPHTENDARREIPNTGFRPSSILFHH